MPISQEQQQLILQDFVEIFQARYGEMWSTKLTSNLRPSPILRMAQKHNVPVSEIKAIRHKLTIMGMMFRAMYDPISYSVVDES